MAMEDKDQVFPVTNVTYIGLGAELGSGVSAATSTPTIYLVQNIPYKVMENIERTPLPRTSHTELPHQSQLGARSCNPMFNTVSITPHCDCAACSKDQGAPISAWPSGAL